MQSFEILTGFDQLFSFIGKILLLDVTALYAVF